jgi:hypothetical protein
MFSEQAPQWFVEKPEIQSVVDALLKSDSALQKEVCQLWTKRSRLSDTNWSTSTSRSNSTNQTNSSNRSIEPKVVKEDD